MNLIWDGINTQTSVNSLSDNDAPFKPLIVRSVPRIPGLYVYVDVYPLNYAAPHLLLPPTGAREYK